MGVEARLAALAGLVACPGCAACGGDAGPTEALCQRCCEALRRRSGTAVAVDGIDQVWVAGPYEGVARDLVAAVKFRRLLPAAREAARAITTEAPSRLLGPGGEIVPVPADPLRRAWRGFDLADLLAGELAALSGRPLTACLRRRRGPRQVGRSRAERLSGPPRVTLAGPVPPRPLLVDDVLTTGATLRACARALRAGGAAEVHALAFAASGTGPAARDEVRLGSGARRA